MSWAWKILVIYCYVKKLPSSNHSPWLAFQLLALPQRPRRSWVGWGWELLTIGLGTVKEGREVLFARRL